MDNVAVARKAWSHMFDRKPGEFDKDELKSRSFFEFVTDDVVLKLAAPTGTYLYGGEFRGKESIRELAEAEREFLDVGPVEGVPEFISDGDRVVMLFQQSFKILKTGVSVNHKLCAIVMDFSDGLISKVVIYEDFSDWNDAYRDQRSRPA